VLRACISQVVEVPTSKMAYKGKHIHSVLTGNVWRTFFYLNQFKF